MPFQKVNHTVKEYLANTGAQAYDYHLDNVNDQTLTAYGLGIQATYVAETFEVQAFVAADVTVAPASTITIVDHGYVTGLLVALSGTNLPTGLSATDYWVIVVDEDTISLANSLDNALAGTKVSISGAGTTADAELTPDALSQVVKLQASIDGENFADISGKTVTVSASGTTIWDLGNPNYGHVRVVVTPAAGAMDLTLTFRAVNN